VDSAAGDEVIGEAEVGRDATPPKISSVPIMLNSSSNSMPLHQRSTPSHNHSTNSSKATHHRTSNRRGREESKAITHPRLATVRHNQDTNDRFNSNSIDHQQVMVLADPDHNKINSQGEDFVLTAVMTNMDPSNFVLRSEKHATTASMLGILLGSVARPATSRHDEGEGRVQRQSATKLLHPPN